MEESSEAHSQDDKTPPETNKKRTVKTRAQVEALEKFYEEHKYPTETMKEQFAKSIGLTDKQVSGWFCHRRLKDKRLANGEGNANGRQDRSSANLQDRGSGLRQDSCGSTKQGDDKNFDQVESRRLTSQDHFAADLNNELGSRHTGNFGLPGDTSSGSSSSLRNMSVPSDKNPINTTCSLYQTQGVPVEIVSVKPRKGPSGYLKVTSRAENPAIAAVKRQLGRYFREDGPALGVRFDPLPPGAFEPPVEDTQNDSYYAPEQDLPSSQDIPTIHKNPHPRTIYVNNSKTNSHYSDADGSRFKKTSVSDHSENPFHQKFEQKSPTFNCGEFYPGRSSSIDMHDGSKRGNPAHDTQEIHRRIKHGVGLMKVDPNRRRLSSHGVTINRGQTEFRPPNYNDIQLKATPAEHFEYKPSSLTSKGDASHGFLDKGPPRRMGKETKLFGQRISRNDDTDSVHLKDTPKDEVPAAKRIRNELPAENFRQPSMNQVPTWASPANQVPRSAAEMPSSFSEDDETADSTSAD